jgi:site-specific DNA recombinase
MKPNAREYPDQTRAVIYARVSSIKQSTRGDGLGSQQTRCLEYARHKGLEVVQIFSDDMTGSLTSRSGMQAMLTYLRKHAKKEQIVVIIDDISRLARGIEAHLKLRTAIDEAGGILKSPSIEFGEESSHLGFSASARQKPGSDPESHESKSCWRLLALRGSGRLSL